MFSTLPAHSFTHHNPAQYYSPQVPSPLSSSPLRRSPSSSPPDRQRGLTTRDANIMSDSPSPSKSTPLSKYARTMSGRENDAGSVLISPPVSVGSKSGSRFSKRATKQNPLMGRGSGDEGRETRRKLFLRRVREEGEERRWRVRMNGGDGSGLGEEEFLRSLWVGESRRLEEERRREVQALGLDLGWDRIEEDGDEDLERIAGVMADEFAREEEAELETLLSQEDTLSQKQQDPSIEELPPWSMHTETKDDRPETDTLYGSDDDEYDHIFMDYVESESAPATKQSSNEFEDQDMMDIS